MRLFVAALLAATLFAPAVAGQPFKPVTVPAPNVPGGKVVLVPRDQLRAGPGTKTMRLPHAVRAAAKDGSIPIPATYDWTKGNTISFPILGNDQWGDCYYACICHDAQARAALVGSPITFNTSQVVARYKVLSRGDNGLSDEDVIPEYKAGIVGPNGPHKILDTLIVSASDDTAIDMAGYLFGPQWFTFTVYNSFMSQAKPGAFIDSVSGGVDGGHAVLCSGKTGRGRKIETWGMSPSVEIGKNFISRVEPEFVAVFSLEWFDAKGYAPNGQHYQTLAPLWNSLGGHVDPVGPFPPPAPVPPVPPIPPVPPVPPQPPLPPMPGGFNGGIFYKDGMIYAIVPGAVPAPPQPPPPPKVTDGEELAAAASAGYDAFAERLGKVKFCPAAIVLGFKLYTDLQAHAAPDVILGDIAAINQAVQACKAQGPMGAVPQGFSAAGDCAGFAGACSAGSCGQSSAYPAAGACGASAGVGACGSAQPGGPPVLPGFQPFGGRFRPFRR